ncbi:hypothetical protein [Ideonella sp. BN130291]|uniref:hypothetical protein n=1 Tax=Ideonella sp. BN130291 TaxID=3112940 RepID=UPI002E276B28|nr:hypothetical protein [Ideonella sp. BN130291]
MTTHTSPNAALLALLITSTAAQADVDATQQRTLITANTVHTLGWADVRGSAGNRSATAVRMFYDTRDSRAGYAGRENFWNQDWSLYIDAESALGPKGPLGYAGPLGSAGPLLNAGWSWAWSSWLPTGQGSWLGSYVWNGQASFGAANPYGAAGPLGASGPLTVTALYTTMPHLNEAGDATTQEAANDYNDFPHQLDPAGVWGVLGPAGPLGVLGPLGPLGPLGYGTSGAVTVDPATREYKNGSQTVRALDVPHTADGTVWRRHALVELYPRDSLVARQANPQQFVNDTSFSVNAYSASCTLNLADRNANTFYFKSGVDQWLALVLTNVNAYAQLDFDVAIKPDPANGFAAASSAAAWFGSTPTSFSVNTFSALYYSGGFNYALNLQDFAMLRVKKGEVIKLSVKSGYSSPTAYDSCGYLLHVVGSGFQERSNGGAWADSALFAPNRVNGSGQRTFNVTGKHQQGVGWWGRGEAPVLLPILGTGTTPVEHTPL